MMYDVVFGVLEEEYVITKGRRKCDRKRQNSKGRQVASRLWKKYTSEELRNEKYEGDKLI